jgi:hypothetical protein
MLIDFAILVNRNVIKKAAEEILKYKTLNNRITGHLENKKSCTGNNRDNCNHIKSFRKYRRNLPGKQEIKQVQETAILTIAHILRELIT